MAQDNNTLARSLHDLGLAAWFGGSLMGAVGLNDAVATVDQPQQRLRVANAGWARWTPVNLVGIAAHRAGGTVLLAGNKGPPGHPAGSGQRHYGQGGGDRASLGGHGLVAGACGATDPGRGRAGGGWDHALRCDAAGAGRGAAQLTVLQWVIPGLTGVALVLNALMGEQQRPQQVTSGLLQGLRSRLPVVALAGTGLLVRARSRRKSTS
jgi:hypothetical protein